MGTDNFVCDLSQVVRVPSRDKLVGHRESWQRMDASDPLTVKMLRSY